MGLKVPGGKVVAVHQLTNRWAIYRDDEGDFFGVPIHARAFVLEKHEEAGGFEYLEAYDLCVEHDGYLEDASTTHNWVANLDAGSEEQAVALATRHALSDEKEKAKRAKQ